MTEINTYIVAPNHITVYIGSESTTINYTDENFEPLKLALINQDQARAYELVTQHINKKNVIESYTNGNITINKYSLIYYKDKMIDGSIVKRIIKMKNNNLDFEPLILFLENLLQNPSEDSKKDLYDFMAANNLPITSDGCFLAYKRVTSDYKSVYTPPTGKVDYAIGNMVRMDRSQVDKDRNNTCSTGLHVCSKDYLPSFGGEKIIVCKINPMDVVAVPPDYNQAKMRVSKLLSYRDITNEYTRDKWAEKDYFSDLLFYD